MKLTPVKRSGFTLIEIVIVLAIAALIMVIVFLAVQGAQRAQRDNTNKAAAGQALAQATQFLANSSGSYPTTVMPSNYFSNIKTTTGNPTAIVPGTTLPTATVAGKVVVQTQATCNGTAAKVGTVTEAAVVWYSESAGTQQCITN